MDKTEGNVHKRTEADNIGQKQTEIDRNGQKRTTTDGAEKVKKNGQKRTGGGAKNTFEEN